MANVDDPVVIELDTAPTTFDPLASGDYVERCIVSALYRPVLQLSSASETHDRFEFDIAHASRFSDGTTVQGEHVLKTLTKSASSSLWARYIRHLEKAEVTDDHLVLTMRQPANFYPDMLQAVDFSPTHPDGQLGNGPYRFGDRFDVGRGYYYLTPNPYFPGAAERPDLVFVIETDVDGAPDRFRRGETDITCSTAFPLDRLSEWRGNAALHSSPTGITMQLEPNLAEGGSLVEPAVRAALLDCLDLGEIASSFAGGLRPTLSVGRVAATGRGTALPPRIRVSYHDFYPNRQVLEKLSAQWQQRLGISTELVERDYADPSRDGVDASFVLRYPAFNHPYASFIQSAGQSSDPAFERLLQRFAAGEPGSPAAVSHHLCATVPVLGLFEVIGHWLVNRRVVGFGWPTDAVFDFTNLRCVDRCPT